MRYNNFRHRNKTNHKARESRARSYEGGYLSRSQIGAKLGLQGLSWHLVQKAMTRAGLVKYDPFTRKATPTEKAEGLWRKEGDVSEQGDIQEWIVWHPSIIEILRKPLTQVLAEPAREQVKAERDYAEGYAPLATIAKAVGIAVTEVCELLRKWDFAQLEGKRIIPTEDSIKEKTAVLYEEGINSWYVWNVEIIAKELKDYLAKGKGEGK